MKVNVNWAPLSLALCYYLTMIRTTGPYFQKKKMCNLFEKRESRKAIITAELVRIMMEVWCGLGWGRGVGGSKSMRETEESFTAQVTLELSLEELW